MLSTSLVKDLTYQEILKRVSEYDIFKHYIQVPFRIGEAILSPLRTEDNPSFVIFNTTNGLYRLRWYDYSTSYSGSCFDFVMRLHRCDFINALIMIDRDMGLGIEDCRVQVSSLNTSPTLLESVRDTISSRIEVGIRKWDNGQDKLYWASYGISCKQLKKYEVYPLSCFRVNRHYYDCRNITYGYYFGNEKWKIYSPYNDIKWLSNTSKTNIQGYNQLTQSGDLLIITKSLKDVILLDSFGIPAIAPQSESSMISWVQLQELQMRFGTIMVNHDFDYIGVKVGNKYRKQYDYKCLYLTNGRFGTRNYGAKDLSDYRKLYGYEKTKELLSNIKRNLNV